MSFLTVPQSTILEVFRRDEFECQFCKVTPRHKPITIYIKKRASAPGYIVDDLVTGCFYCITDSEYRDEVKEFMAIQEPFLKELPPAKEQFAIMLEWQKSNIKKDSYLCLDLLEHWNTLNNQRIHTKEEYNYIFNLMSQFSYNVIEQAMNEAHKQYLGKTKTKAAVETAFNKIGGIAHNLTNPNEQVHALNYIVATLKNREIVENERQIMHCKVLINKNLDAGVSSDIIKQVAKQTKSYQDFIFSIQL